MQKTLLSLLILFISVSLVKAQDFPYDAVNQAELSMKRYAGDTAAHALVLDEHGTSRITIGSDDNIKLMYEYHVKIKIFDNKAFDKGTVEIPVYNNSDADSYEDIEGIKGVTYFTDESGMSNKVELEHKKIYPVKESKHLAIYKFAMPGIRAGCVIEYKYTIISPYFDNFHPWEFQDDIPKLRSEYEVHIPGFYTYNASLKGFLKLSKNTSEVESKCFETHGASADCSHIIYGMTNIPAFITDDYMTSPKNYLSAINFELVEYTSPYDGVKHNYTKAWKDIDYALKSEPYFGGQLKRKGVVKDKVLAIIAGKTDDTEKAKAIYTYWQKNFKWNEYGGIYSVDGIGKAMDSHSGSVADINLSLVTALNAAGLNAETVLLSTRANGTLNTLYPAVGDFNYVVAKVNIGDKSYFLDATDNLLPFGMLPLKCLNDKGRVFSLDKPSYFVDLNLPQKQKNTYTLDLTLQEDGKLKGSVTHYSIGYEAYLKRRAIRKFNSTDEYIEDFSGKLAKTKVFKSEIVNLDSLDMPLGERYDVEINLYNNNANDNRLAFNPFILDKVTTNPFKLASRSYPVDWGMPSDDRVVLLMHLPAQYTIENPPKAFSIGMPNDGGKFMTSYEAGENSFSFSNVLQFNKGIYSSEEYPYLKELYNKVIQSEMTEMVFKKK